MHLQTLPTISGTYRVLGLTRGVGGPWFLGPGGKTVADIVSEAETQMIHQAEKLSAWGVIAVSYELTSHSDAGTSWVIALVSGTAISEPQ